MGVGGGPTLPKTPTHPSPPPPPTVGRALPADDEVLSVMEAWYDKPDAKLIFQCKL